MSGSQQAPLPIYQQVANALRSQILSQEADRPIRLPNEEQLALTHGVARGTIRQALQVLRSEGLIEQARGRGTVTVPAGIRACRQLRGNRVIKVICSRQSLPDLTMDFHGQIYQGILVRAEECGHPVAITRLSRQFPRFDGRFSPEDPEQIIGLIMIAIIDERMVDMHVRAGYPVVCTDYWPANSQADGVVFDCYGEGQQATNFLLGQGHRTIFYLGNTDIDDDNRAHHESDADLMAAGCRRALEEAGLSLPARRVRFAVSRPSEVEPAVDWFLAMHPRPTAGVIFDRIMLERFIACLRQRGVRCPEDVSLICKAASTANTDVAAMRNDPYLMGRLAVDLLLERAAGKRRIGIRTAIASTLYRGTTVRHLDV